MISNLYELNINYCFEDTFFSFEAHIIVLILKITEWSTSSCSIVIKWGNFVLDSSKILKTTIWRSESMLVIYCTKNKEIDIDIFHYSLQIIYMLFHKNLLVFTVALDLWNFDLKFDWVIPQIEIITNCKTKKTLYTYHCIVKKRITVHTLQFAVEVADIVNVNVVAISAVPAST